MRERVNKVGAGGEETCGQMARPVFGWKGPQRCVFVSVTP